MELSEELDGLVRRHESRLYGFLRPRVADDATAEDLAQETWVEVLRHANTFDPEQGTFWTFTRIWADFALRRHWRTRQRERSRAAAAPPSIDPEGGELDAGEHPDIGRLTADEAARYGEDLRNVLHCALSCARPPNEKIAYGFSKLGWTRQEIAMDLTPEILNSLAARLEHDYRAIVPDPGIAEAFAALREALAQCLSELAFDPRSKHAYAHVPDVPTGSLALEAFVGPDASVESSVSRWCEALKRAVFARLDQEGFFDDSDAAPKPRPNRGGGGS